MLRYAEFLRQELRARGFTARLIKPRAILGKLFRRNGFAFKWLRYVDMYVLFPLKLRAVAGAYSVVHICDHSNSLYLNHVPRDRCLITCHDVFGIKCVLGHYPEAVGSYSARMRRRMAWTLAALKEIPNIICVSAKTKEDLIELLGKSYQRRLSVIPNPLNWAYAPMPREKIGAVLAKLNANIGQRYFLHIGGNQWYKNRVGVLKLFRSLQELPRFREVQLVMAGKPWTAEMRAVYSESNRGNVVEVVDPSNDEVQALYSGAIALLFPSLQEGFGWPLLEAQACGCPVVTSDRAPMTEIAADSAIFIDPKDPTSGALKIDRELHDRHRLIMAGFENLKRFDKDSVMRQYSDLYREIASDR